MHPFHVKLLVLYNVLSSSVEAEIGSAFVDSKQAVIFRTTLRKLGHLQPPTPIQTDNTTVDTMIKGTIIQKRTKTIDMRCYRLCK